jgi:pimeloyl-ACP methyl ester carboxylesterase
MAPLVPMVLVHGGGGVGQLWQNQLLAFPRAVAPDLPGHPEGPGFSTVSDMAGWILRFIDERAIGPCVLGGHSLGGGVALQAALDAPERLRGLILVGTGSRLRVRPEFFEQLRGDYDEAIGELLRWWFSPQASTRVVDRARRALRALSPAVVHDDFWAADHFDVTDRLREIRLPTLIVCGAEDRMTPMKYAESLHRHIAGSRLVAIPGAGHMVILEQPRACNEAIAEFLEGFPGP